MRAVIDMFNAGEFEEEEPVKPFYITKKSDSQVGIWVTDGMWKRHVLPDEWNFVLFAAQISKQPVPVPAPLGDQWWDSLPVAG
jgi:hypothetical protein